jgi:hypothetical protein
VADAAEASEQKTEPGNGASGTDGGHKTAVRAAAIAAATGATAFAAKKAFSGREQRTGGGDAPRRRRLPRAGDESTVGAMLASGWEAAKDSLLPFAEDAADAAGKWVARNGPEVVSETIVPRFIRGFEKARRAPAGDAE